MGFFDIKMFFNCVFCETWLRPNSNGFCSICALKLEQESSRSHFFLNRRIKGFSRYVWSENNDVMLRPLIYSIKGGENRHLIKKLSGELSHLLLKNNLHKEIDVIIPIPSGYKNKKDHAFFLAEEISLATEIPMRNVLRWEYKRGAQKSKKKSFRRELRASVECPTKDLNNKTILLVDDVITTGATMIAAGQAIKSPKKIYAISVSCKV